MRYQQYEARHVEKILGISKNRLLFWLKTYGLIKPDVEQGIGTGNRNRFSKNNLLELAIIKEMASFGIDLHTIKSIKNMIDHQKIASWEKEGKVYNNEPEGPENFTKKSVAYYDWAFSGSYDVGMNIFRKEDDEGGGFWIEQWELTDRPVREDKVRGLFGHKALLYLNVSLMARKLQEKLT